MSENIKIAIIGAIAGLIASAIGAFVVWFIAKRATQQSLDLHRSQFVQDASQEVYQPLYAAIETLKKKIESQPTIDELRETCIQFIHNVDELIGEGKELYLEKSILIDLTNLKSFISRSLIANEAKIRYTVTGPGINGLFENDESNIMVGEKAARFFSLPEMTEQPPSQYNVIVTEVIEAPLDNKAFNWNLSRDIERIKVHMRQCLHI